MKKKWIVLGVVVLIGLGIIFGDTKRFHHLCIAPILKLIDPQDMCGDRTDTSLLRFDTEDDNYLD